jgi:hypothetical protein
MASTTSIDTSGNITYFRNTTFFLDTEYQDKDGNPIDLTGSTAKMQVRTALCDDVCSELLLELSTANGKIVLGGTAGTVVITDTDDAAQLLPCGQYYYDLIIYTGTQEDQYFKGVKLFIVKEGITRV